MPLIVVKNISNPSFLQDLASSDDQIGIRGIGMHQKPRLLTKKGIWIHCRYGTTTI
jgi:hypothetical protein